MSRLLALATLLLAFAGCDSAEPPPDYSALPLGEFVFELKGSTYRGEALYDPLLSSASAPAKVFLVSTRLGDTVALRSDAFLTAVEGDTIEPSVGYRPGDAGYQRLSGSLEVLEVTDAGIRGQFAFRLRDYSTGPFRAEDLDVEGGFYARLDPSAPAPQ